MIKVAADGTINAPIEKVWNFMVDLGTMPQRDPSVTSVDWKPPLRVGSVAIMHFRQLRKITGKYEVIELEPNRRMTVQMTAIGAKAEGTWLFEPIAEGKTSLSASVQIDVHGPIKLISPYLSFSANRDARRLFDRVKRAIEAQSFGALGPDPTAD